LLTGADPDDTPIGLTPDNVRVGVGGGNFAGISDIFASSRSQCVQIATAKCGTCNTGGCSACKDVIANTTGVCDYYQEMGFRNEFNITRFLWDAIDDYNEGNEATNRSIGQLVDELRSMPCTSNGNGSDGNCREPQANAIGNCQSLTDTGAEFTFDLERFPGGNGTRDAYSAVDIAWEIEGDQQGARYLNCLDTAGLD
jgi:hypothetical protein